MKKKIILRADGNAIIGHGHIYRLLALTDILKNEFDIVFASSMPGEHLVSVIENYADELIELPERPEYKLPSSKQADEEIPFDLAGYLKGDEIVVLDGYWFGTNYQMAVKNTGAKLVCIDDFAEDYFYADAVINHAPGMKASQYRGEPFTKYYLGLDFALLRKDFFKPFSGNRQPGSLLISMGGTDQYGITEHAVESAILSRSFKLIHVLVSSAFSEEVLGRMNERAQLSAAKIGLRKNLSAAELVELMDSCSFALVSASTVLLECYSRGMTCFTGYYTNNQRNIYSGFIAGKMAIGLGDLNTFETKAMATVLKSRDVIKRENSLRSDLNIKEIFTLLC